AAGEDETATDDAISPRDSHPFEQIFRYSNDAILVVDPEAGEITRANERATEMLGYDREELLSLAPADIHPHDYEEFRQFASTVYEEGASWTSELSCYTCDDEVIPAEISGTLVEIDGERRLLASIRDISTRIEQQRRLRRLSRAVEATTDGIALFERDGTVAYANHAFATGLGYDDPETLRGRRWRSLYDDGDRFEMDVLPSADGGDGWTDTVTITVDDEERVHSLSVTSFEDDLLCVSRDVTEEHEHRERLRGLTEASRAFVDAADRDTVAEVAVDVIRETLGFDCACLRLYDSQRNTLERAAVTPAAEQLLQSELAYDLEASRAGRAYRTGDSVVNNPSDDAYAADRAHLHVPVGEQGVVTVLRQEGSFSETDVGLLELFAETLRTAFTRAERIAELQSRQTELQRRGDELAAANEFNDLVTDVIRSVLETTTRAETEHTVCDRLAASDLYDAAWLVGDGTGPTTSVRASAVAADGAFVETDATEFVRSPFATQLLSEARRTGELVVRQRRFESGDADATEDLTTAAAVPVADDTRSFGTLVVASVGGDASRRLTRSGLELLAETLLFALTADRTRAALVSNEVIEVEFGVENRLAELAAATDCRCVLQSVEATGEGTFTHLIDVREASPAAVTEFFDGVDTVHDPQVVETTDDGCVIRVTAVDALPELLADAGGNVRSVVATAGQTRVTVEVPTDTELQPVLARLDDRYDGAQLLAKRQRSRVDPGRALGDTEETLTDRQREVLCTAHQKGYYEWPREHTAEEVAAELDIAGSTLHQHLRTAERRLVARLCEE
ncbi:MAG: bacterio-opsin activator domain-containing protein, partial [Halobaculum sp.]